MKETLPKLEVKNTKPLFKLVLLGLGTIYGGLGLIDLIKITYFLIFHSNEITNDIGAFLS